MRYVIVCLIKGEALSFHEKLVGNICSEFKVKRQRLPAHFTIKAPFDYDDISELEKTLENFSKTHKKAPYNIKGYNHFDNRAIYMEVNMSREGKILHDELFDELNKIDYINFGEKDGKDKIFHVTISSKKIQKIFHELWDYINHIPCDFDCEFDNISIFKWQDNTWKLHKEFNLK